MSGAAILYGALIHPSSPLIQQQRYHYISPPIPIRPLCISPLTTAIVSTTSVLQRDSAVELASSSPSIDSNDTVSPQNETVELETERHTDETVPRPLSSEYKGTRLRKKKDDDVVSDNRFKLRNGREVFEEKAYLVGVERKNDVQDFGIEESLSELAQLADTAGLLVVGSTYQK
ncbi:hypothetical protein LR48_Vigan07g280800 [Vigna angularis]|nr:hypothetical protein LR48_Vigan07g280800 [Vigna angularis]